MPKPRALAALVPLLLLTATATACGTEQGPGAAPAGTVDPGLPVSGTHWSIKAVTVDGRRSTAPADARVEFEEDGRAQGNTGCNHFGATAEVNGDVVTVTQHQITMRGCPGDRDRFEKALVTAFSGPLKGTIKGERFTLASTDGRNGLELAAEPGAPLRGTTWKIDSLVSGGTAASLPAGASKARFVLGEDGRVTGNLGCNNFAATARVDGTTLTVEGPAATTRMMCASAEMELETKLYELLDGPLTYRHDHRTLTLTDPSGEGLTATAAG
ncbi:META domain-containing protein [Streptomyces sp. SBC-4]|nr:META domain-containing protein [Streptomyces sp. SBC-4]MDV5147150.1 META domain-containing protein [Streptomyces sp. SBC-4]